MSLPSDGSYPRRHICLQLERLTPRKVRITDGPARCIAVSTPSLPSPWYERMLYCSYVLSGLAALADLIKGTFISHVSALPLVHIFTIL